MNIGDFSGFMRFHHMISRSSYKLLLSLRVTTCSCGQSYGCPGCRVCSYSCGYFCGLDRVYQLPAISIYAAFVWGGLTSPLPLIFVAIIMLWSRSLSYQIFVWLFLLVFICRVTSYFYGSFQGYRVCLSGHISVR